MNLPFHKGAEAVEQSFANFDRRIALSFGVLILALMVIVLLAGGLYYRDFAEREQDKLSTLVTQILAKSVNRISFSGKYHSRLLLEEIARNEPGIRYIRVADKQGNVLASSDPERNDTQLDQRAQEAAGKVMLGQPRVIRDYRIDDDPVREITVPYLSGLDNEIAGVIQVGLLDRDRVTAFRHGLLIVGALVLFLMIVGIAVTRSISLRFGRPVIRLASDLSATLQAIPDLMFELDQDGRYLNVMATHENLLAAPGEVLLGRTVREMLPEQAADTVMTALEVAGESGSAYGLEISLPLAEGTGWFELSVAKKAVAAGEMPRYIVLSRDITGRKLDEKALRESERFLDAIVEHVPNMLFVKDAKELKFVRFNLAGERLLGYTRDELLGKNDYDLFPKEQADFFTSKDREIFDGGEMQDIQEEPISTRNLGQRYLHTRKIPIYADDGSPLYLLGISEDITERKQAEEEIKTLNRELEQRVAARTADLEAANKELESFSYSISHDLRTPLRAIDGYSHILLDDYAGKLDDEGKRLLNTVRANTIRMAQLIDDILNFSRTGRSEMTSSEIDMEKMAREVFEELQPSNAGSGVQCEIEQMPPAMGDRAMMRQVFVNLLSNAVKFSSTRGTPRIKVGAARDGNETVYYVKDNGVGFNMEYAGKLFGVFQRLHSVNEFEGTGIGLAIVKRIITRHGGRVWAESRVNEGATIYFALPAGEKSRQ